MTSFVREKDRSRRSVLQLGLSVAFVPMAPAIVRAQASDLPSVRSASSCPLCPVGRPTRSAA